MDSDIINMDEVMERVENDRELLIELMDIFLADCPDKIRKLREAVEARDFETIGEVAHSLKGSSGNLAAKRISQIFLEIEQAGKAQDASGINQKLDEVESLLTELKSFHGQLKSGTGG